MTDPDDDHLPTRRRGFLASLAEGFMPQPVDDDDDDGPLIAPRGVKIGSVLAMLGGLVYVVFYGMALTKISTFVDDARAGYQAQVDSCTDTFGGFGTAVVTQTDPTGTAAACQTLPHFEASYWDDTYHTVIVTISLIYILIGLALVAAGWFLRVGRMWARRVLIIVAVVTVLATLFVAPGDLITTVSSLLTLVALILSYFGSGGRYFLRVKARRHT